MAMERIFGGYIKAHGYAIAVAALTFGCIFALKVAHVDKFHHSTRTLDHDDYGGGGDIGSSGDGELFLNQSQHNSHYYVTDGPPYEMTTRKKTNETKTRRC